MHPVKEIREEKSDKLKDKKIILGITGSIAAVESFYLCRELIRHGADVIPIMTEASTKIIHPNSIEYASGHRPIVNLTGDVEHVSFCNGDSSDRVDAVIVSPCTSNTLSKIAHGISDNPITACVTTAEGSEIPVILIPAMHLAMYKNPAVEKNVAIVKKRGITIIDPSVERSRVRIADVDKIIHNVIRIVGNKKLDKRKILIIGGATAESIDDIRVITNRSSGKMAISLAVNAFEMGADVELWIGWSKEDIPPYIATKRFESVEELTDMIKPKIMKRFDTVIVCAAISNYVPERYRGKISSSRENLNINMKKAPSVIGIIKKIKPTMNVVAFKAEEDEEKIADIAFKFLIENKVDLVIANTVDSFGKDKSGIWIVSKNGVIAEKNGEKDKLAREILTRV